MTRDQIGEALFLSARNHGAIKEIRLWNERHGTEEYNGATWKTKTAGLSESEKERWRKVGDDILRQT